MATFKDPVQCFAPMEVIERLLEIRSDMGFNQSIYIPSTSELADLLDAYGFSTYSFTQTSTEFTSSGYTSPAVPGGESAIHLEKAH